MSDEPRDLDFRPVTGANWDAFERFFSAPGAPKHCWCMVWRRTAAEAKLQAPAERKRMMRSASLPARRSGFSPMTARRRSAGCRSRRAKPIARSAARRRSPARSIWSLTCFYVPRRLRGDGAGAQADRRCRRPREGERRDGGRGLSGRSGVAELPLHGLRPGLRRSRLPRPRHDRHAAPRHAAEWRIVNRE